MTPEPPDGCTTQTPCYEFIQLTRSKHQISVLFQRVIFVTAKAAELAPQEQRLALYLRFTETITHFYTSVVRNTIALCGQGFIHSNTAMPPHWDIMPDFKTKEGGKKASKDVCMETCKHLYCKMAVVFFPQIAEVHIEAFTLL